MQETRERDRCLAEPHGRSRHEQSIHDEDSLFPDRAHDAPARIGFDLPCPDRTRQNEIGIAPSYVLERDLSGWTPDVRIDIFCSGDIDELVHKAAGADGDERC